MSANFKPVTNKNSKTADFRHLWQTVVTGVTLGVRFCSLYPWGARISANVKRCHYLSHLSLIEFQA